MDEKNINFSISRKTAWVIRYRLAIDINIQKHFIKSLSKNNDRSSLPKAKKELKDMEDAFNEIDYQLKQEEKRLGIKLKRK